MMSVRYIIVKANFSDPYEGMDRPPLGAYPDVSERLILRGMALEDLSGAVAEARYRELLSDIASAGDKGYELLALRDAPSLDNWEFLGFDVGEDAAASWSAIANRNVFLSPEDADRWERRLNPHGLFDERSDAEAYLAKYMASDDPDKGWTEKGWVDEPGIYAVIPIYRYKLEGGAVTSPGS